MCNHIGVSLRLLFDKNIIVFIKEEKAYCVDLKFCYHQTVSVSLMFDFELYTMMNYVYSGRRQVVSEFGFVSSGTPPRLLNT